MPNYHKITSSSRLGHFEYGVFKKVFVISKPKLNNSQSLVIQSSLPTQWGSTQALHRIGDHLHRLKDLLKTLISILANLTFPPRPSHLLGLFWSFCFWHYANCRLRDESLLKEPVLVAALTLKIGFLLMSLKEPPMALWGVSRAAIKDDPYDLLSGWSTNEGISLRIIKLR